jgi:hypothetical protein
MGHPVSLTMNSLLLHNGKISTLDLAKPEASALLIREGRIAEVGGEELAATTPDGIPRIDLRGRRVIPGLNDSHLHLIRGGLNYNLELRWDGVPSLADALRMLRIQAARTPAPQWVRVVGSWSEFQFAECRRSTRSTRLRRTRRCSFCTSTAGRC